MKKAVIQSGSRQYLVAEGEELKADLIKTDGKVAEFEPLLVIDGDKVSVGTPNVDKAKVTADIIEADVKADKVTAVRYKAKKRVRKVHGHRQRQTTLKIKKITVPGQK
jgi:large subunit ribosomal protein L21